MANRLTSKTVALPLRERACRHQTHMMMGEGCHTTGLNVPRPLTRQNLELVLCRPSPARGEGAFTAVA